jgi:CRP/FNR family transcriptional regulator
MINEAIQKCHMCFPFWEKLTQNEKELLEQHTSIVKYSKGENIHSGGSVCKGPMIIKSGSLRTYLLSEGGREVTLYRMFSDDVCILSASCVLDNINFDVFVDAEEDSEVVIISASAFQSVMNSNVYVECYAYKMIAESFSNVMWAVQQILFTSFDRRLAFF